MKFFCLLHSKMGFECLKNLISEKCIPEFVIIHNQPFNNKQEENFYSQIKKLCGENLINLYSVDSVNEIKNEVYDTDAGICVGFMEILKRDFFNIPGHGILNLHCGKLPEYRGRAPICRTIMNDEKSLTVTMHRIDEGIDSGEICNELQIKITDEDNVNTLYDKCSGLSSELVIDSLTKLKNGELKFYKQHIHNKPNKIISKDERKINWNDDRRKIFNLIRAITFPYPAACAQYKTKAYNFLNSEIMKNETGGPDKSGKILNVSKDFLVVETNGGKLKIKKILDEQFREVDYLQTFTEGEFFR